MRGKCYKLLFFPGMYITLKTSKFPLISVNVSLTRFFYAFYNFNAAWCGCMGTTYRCVGKVFYKAAWDRKCCNYKVKKYGGFSSNDSRRGNCADVLLCWHLHFTSVYFLEININTLRIINTNNPEFKCTPIHDSSRVYITLLRVFCRGPVAALCIINIFYFALLNDIIQPLSER